MFRDRSEAGRALGRALAARIGEDPALGGPGDARVVLALPRGGVPVAIEVARALNAPLGLVMVRKIGLPWHRELAAAAVVDGGEPVLVKNEDVIAGSGMTEADLRDGMERELKEIERRRALWLGGGGEPEVTGRVAIVVDDGIATGATAVAALRALRRRGPKSLVIAAPVAPHETRARLEAEADLALILETPPDFMAVGAHYAVFDQVADESVREMLDRARERAGTAEEGERE